MPKSFQKIYKVEIRGQEYSFELKTRPNGNILLVIPNVGGDMEAMPLHPRQYKWIKTKIQTIKGINPIWTTVWELTSEKVLKNVEEIFKSEGELAYEKEWD
ncbi:MAG: hypothetical protein GF383_04495 [Candidatus Lokiarchaeota archaeon]|nr:hypothetical protein [Candidatus Lokiarchaeota archaeon]MBD3339044.1 hypothetical protein [Candidatus Lokiarchaeota archaeon]